MAGGLCRVVGLDPTRSGRTDSALGWESPLDVAEGGLDGVVEAEHGADLGSSCFVADLFFNRIGDYRLQLKRLGVIDEHKR